MRHTISVPGMLASYPEDVAHHRVEMYPWNNMYISTSVQAGRHERASGTISIYGRVEIYFTRVTVSRLNTSRRAVCPVFRKCRRTQSGKDVGCSFVVGKNDYTSTKSALQKRVAELT